jgi:hypothetical protein
VIEKRLENGGYDKIVNMTLSSIFIARMLENYRV